MQKEQLDLVLYVVFTSLFVLILVIAIIMLFRIYLKRKNTLLQEKERMSIEFEQTLLRSRLEIQEQTFTHISEEIHDNIGQVLSLVRINLNTLNSTAQEEKINLMDTLMDKAITDLRSLSHSLNTNFILKTGWAGAAKQLFLDLQKTNAHKVSMDMEEDLPGIGNEKSIILFRMIQEITNNIIKHAAATEIKFSAASQNQGILISILDNGKGFNTRQTNGGVGLQNLKTRAKMINASFNIQSEPGNGTTATISLNLQANEQ